MADKKISQLTAATAPLAGTEVLPIVQGTSTVKVANNDLRPKQIQSNATSGVLQIVGPAAAVTRVMTTPDTDFTVARTDAAQSFSGNQTLSTGNLVIGTSGKGIDFSVTSEGSGTMTSELLADYEEGTFTPTVFGGTDAGTATYSTQVGLYTKVGRQVTVTAYINWSGGNGTGSLNFGGLPYTTNSNNYGAGAIWAEIGLAASNTLVLRILGSSTSLQPLNTPVGGGVSNTVTYTASGAVMLTATYFV